MAIKGKELVEKRNILNEVRKNSMSLQELRFFSIYLSKINARDVSTRKVTFPLTDFQKIMELGRMNIKHMQAVTNSLLGKVINIKLENGGYEAFQLFKRCKVYRNEFDQWFIDIDAHDDALPLMFDFKREYFTYELWNALKLKSANQLRMYELLKQYEKSGERKMTLVEIRSNLGIGDDEYPRWDRFSARVLNSCQQSLLENTDIKFTYEPIKAGRKITGVHFYISKNNDYVDQLTLDEFIDLQKPVEVDVVYEISLDDNYDDDGQAEVDFRDKRGEICNGFEDEIFDEFTDEQLFELRTLAWGNVDPDEVERERSILHDIKMAKEYVVSHYIRRKILMCNAQGKRIKHRYGYIKRAVDKNYQ